jgi:hypothetical protein
MPSGKSLEIGMYRRSETSWVRCKKSARQNYTICRVFRGASWAAHRVDCRGFPAILGFQALENPSA